MQVLFESRPEIIRVEGRLHFAQCQPRIRPEPVVVGDTPVDAAGVMTFGSVLYDGGRYRMWYQAWPDEYSYTGSRDTNLVAYAESDDGVVWRKPNLNRVEYRGSKANNLVNMGVHHPSVFIDPTAPPSHRYRATGSIDSRYKYAHPYPSVPREGAYFTLHSTDGIHWEPDSPEPTWLWADNIVSIWHPGRGQGEVLMKRMVHVNGMARRAWWNATLNEGKWSAWKQALVPDDYDDVLARHGGHVSADYYNMGLMPSGMAMVAFVVHFRHRHPLTPFKLQGGSIGALGETEVTLAYQSEDGACWLHTPGRPDFLKAGDVPWASNGWYVPANVVECGNEQRLYATGTNGGHHVAKPPELNMLSSIGIVSWPKWRLFEFRARPQGEMDIDLGVLTQPVELVLNYQTHVTGVVRVQISSVQPLYTLEAIPGRGKEDCVPLVGDELEKVVQWNGGSIIYPVAGRHLTVRLFIEHASVFAYDVRAVKS